VGQLIGFFWRKFDQVRLTNSPNRYIRGEGGDAKEKEFLVAQLGLLVIGRFTNVPGFLFLKTWIQLLMDEL
jgi:hypothetical protein